ncbi:MAG: Na+/H+ antiporter subunit G [Rhodobacterales bacterium]|nr:Na+/H+ antiporter subunit G [Rhodobacterales bacterium]
MTLIAELLISALLVVGALFGLAGNLGLLKLPDTMTRLHAPTKATTVGVGTALIGSMVYFLVFQGTFTWHELLITLFLLLSAPLTANLIAKAYVHRSRGQETRPPSATGAPWATLETDAQAAARQDGPAAES